MFVLQSKINIDKYRNIKPAEVKIEKSVYSFVEKAVIKLPIRSYLPDKNNQYNQKGYTIIETPTLFQEGMPVVINLGYNNEFQKEFQGFVSKVTYTSPTEILCEGYTYQLRKRTYLQTFKNTSLKEILRYLVTGTDIKLDETIPDISIVKFTLENHSGTEALVNLKKLLENTISIRFDNNILIAELFPVVSRPGIVKYQLGWNTIRDNNLEKADAKNTDVEVHFIGEVKDGTTVKVIKNGKTRTKDNVVKTSASAGQTGEKKVFITHAVTDKNALTNLSEAKHYQLTFGGYNGKITTFLQPFCACGYNALITDKKYPERNGSYIVTSMEVSYGMSGARRKVGLTQIT